MPIEAASTFASATSDAGMEGDTPVTARARSPRRSAATAATNVESTPAEKATMAESIEPMIARGRGQIAIMSSLAAFRGFAGSAAYCASKAAVRIWGEAMRNELAGHGVEVSVVTTPVIGADMVAAMVAKALNASKLVYLTGATADSASVSPSENPSRGSRETHGTSVSSS